MQYFNRFDARDRICIISIPKRDFVDSFRSYCGIEQEKTGNGFVLNDYQDRWCKEYVKTRNDLKIQKWEF